MLFCLQGDLFQENIYFQLFAVRNVVFATEQSVLALLSVLDRFFSAGISMKMYLEQFFPHNRLK